MRVVPRNQARQVQFFSTHLPVWAAAAEEIGSTPADIAELQAMADEARAALVASDMAHAAARSATLRLRSAMEAMGAKGATIIQQVRARAAVAGDQVYQVARISAPDEPSPLGEPGTPTRFSFTLDGIGRLHLKWACKNPRGSVGTIYQVSRQVGGSGPFDFIGVAGTKRFIDANVPAGAGMIVYQVQAIRTTRAGIAAQFIVNLGRTSTGGAGAVPAIQLRSTRRDAA